MLRWSSDYLCGCENEENHGQVSPTFKWLVVSRMFARTIFGLLLASFLLIETNAGLIQATVKLQGPNPKVKGNLTLAQTDGGPVSIWGKVTGLNPGRHAFHVHTKGDITGGCPTTGEHYNPFKRPHGDPSDEEHHAGDLGNVLANKDGKALVSFTIADGSISLEGPRSILGRALIIHWFQDLGKGMPGNQILDKSEPERTVCGTIGIQYPAKRK